MPASGAGATGGETAHLTPATTRLRLLIPKPFDAQPHDIARAPENTGCGFMPQGNARVACRSRMDVRRRCSRDEVADIAHQASAPPKNHSSWCCRFCIFLPLTSVPQARGFCGFRHPHLSSTIQGPVGPNRIGAPCLYPRYRPRLRLVLALGDIVTHAGKPGGRNPSSRPSLT